MGNFLSLKSEDLGSVREAVLRNIRAGNVAVLASEYGYIYAVDAFNSQGVERIGAIRGSDPGTACQVFVGEIKTVSGVARNFDGEANLLAENFWPGALTLLLAPQQGLSWDLGDSGSLDEFALRIPSHNFLLEVLRESGPLAVASASVIGRPPTLDINYVPALPSDVGIYVDEGALQASGRSTVVRQRISGLEMVREGDISFEQLQGIISGISRG
jgi:tRNA threonylcarbamoyl adenosine modification protein (Sua5/YciO/YrdC/YwlC family)